MPPRPATWAMREPAKVEPGANVGAALSTQRRTPAPRGLFQPELVRVGAPVLRPRREDPVHVGAGLLERDVIGDAELPAARGGAAPPLVDLALPRVVGRQRQDRVPA